MQKISMKVKANSTNKTFNEGFEDFIFQHCILKNLRPSTERHYREMVMYSLYKFLDKDTKLKDFNQKTVNDYILWLKNRDIKDTTINIQLKCLKTIVKFFKQKRWIDNSINVELLKVDEQQIEPYTDEEIEKLLKKPNLKKCSFAEYRNWVIVNFFCNTGCRRSTLINIKVEDLDIENGYCTFRHTKNRKRQVAPISFSMCNILEEYLEYLPQNCVYLFPTISGEQMKVRSLTHTMEIYNKNREVYRTGCHKFRHWFAKTAVLNGMDIIRLQEILGHSNLENLKRYVKLLTKDLKYNEVELNPLETTLKKQKEQKYIKMRNRNRG